MPFNKVVVLTQPDSNANNIDAAVIDAVRARYATYAVCCTGDLSYLLNRPHGFDLPWHPKVAAHYALTAAAQACEQIEDNTLVVCCDAWLHPVSEIRNYVQMSGLSNVRIAAIYPGGPAVPGDFSCRWGKWAVDRERLMLESADVLALPSDYARKCLGHQHIEWERSQLVVTRLPLVEHVQFVDKIHLKDCVVFPHRWDVASKGVDLFTAYVRACRDAGSRARFVVTTPYDDFATRVRRTDPESLLYDHCVSMGVEFVCLPRVTELHEFFAFTATHVVGAAAQELFGYSVLKAVLSGCTPITFRGACYEAMYPLKYCYTGVPHACASGLSQPRVTRDDVAAIRSRSVADPSKFLQTLEG